MLMAMKRYTGMNTARWMIAFAYTLFMVILLVQQAEKPVLRVGVPPGPPSLEREIVFTTLHVFFFGLMTWLWRWTLIGRATPVMALGLAVFVTLFVGVTTEFAQFLVSDRSPSIQDFFANIAGALVIVIWARWREKRVLLH
jgi:VanZ family protein